MNRSYIGFIALIFSGVTSLCAQQVFDKGIEVNGASSFNGNVHVNENGAMKISLSPSEGMGRVKCGELYLQKNGASDTYYDPYISFQYDTYNSRWYLGSKVYDRSPGSRSNGPLYMDVSVLDVDGRLNVTDSAKFNGFVGMGALTLQGVDGKDLNAKFDTSASAWNLEGSSSLNVNTSMAFNKDVSFNKAAWFWNDVIIRSPNNGQVISWFGQKGVLASDRMCVYTNGNHESSDYRRLELSARYDSVGAVQCFLISTRYGESISYPLKFGAEDFSFHGNSLSVKKALSDSVMINLSGDGTVSAGALKLRQDGVDSGKNPTLEIQYNEKESSWDLGATGDSANVPATLNMNVDKLVVNGDMAFGNVTNFEDTVKIHKDIVLCASSLRGLDSHGYRVSNISSNGSMSALKNFTLFSENGSKAYYPSLKIVGSGGDTATAFSIFAKLSNPSGVYYFPLEFSAKNFSFAGNSLSLKKQDTDSAVIVLSEDGTVNAGALSLRPGGADSGKTPSLEIQYNEDESAWDLGVKSDSANANAALNMKVGKLNVDGPIFCKSGMKVAEVEAEKMRVNDVTVDMDHAADYVFDENYDLKSLDEVEAFVKENKHLPGIPSASKMKEEGMSLSEMSNLLLEKVEELTLHLIRVEKENRELKAEMERMRNEK